MAIDRPTAAAPVAGEWLAATISLAPGLAFAGGLALIAAGLEPWTTRLSAAAFGRPVTITAPVLAIVIGVALHGLAARPLFTPGTTFAVKRLLRWAIALFGLKIAFADILSLGLGTAVMVAVTMAATLASGVVFARALGLSELFGALAGSATAVCGASAALATASVLPPYKERDADTAFVAISVNLLATAALVLYPPLCALAGFDDRTTGILLGASIHDVAQVVGAGYSVSDTAGNVATIVKLFRVFLLLPIVVGIGWWFAAAGADAHKAKAPAPLFAFAFLGFVILNSTGLLPAALKGGLIEASRWGLIVAIAALGLNTSLSSILRVGPRPVLVAILASLVTLALPMGWLLFLR